MTREQKVLLAIALGIAALLRLWGVTNLELTHWDEGVYAGFGLGYGPGFRGDPWIIYAPPLYPALVAIGYALLGAQPWVAIAVSGVMGVIGVFVVARLTAAWFSERAGVIAAFLLAFEPIHVAHSRLALTETTFCVMLLAALLFATRALESNRAGDAVRVGAWSGLATLTKFHGFLPLAAYGVFALFRKRPALACVAGFGFLPAAALAAWLIHDTCGFERFAESREQWVNGLRPWTIRQTLEFAWALINDHGSLFFSMNSLIGLLVVLFSKPRPTGPWLGLLTLFLLSIVLCTYRNYARLFVPAFVLLVPFGACFLDGFFSRRPQRFRAWEVGLGIVLIVSMTWREWMRIHEFRGDGYARMGEVVKAQLTADPTAEVVAVAQQAIFPYLGRELSQRVFSINEQEAIDRLEDDVVRYLLVDQDPWRHGRASPFRESLEPRLVEVARVDNPLPAMTLLDRLGPNWRRRTTRGDGRPALDSERCLILYRIDPSPR